MFYLLQEGFLATLNSRNLFFLSFSEVPGHMVCSVLLHTHTHTCALTAHKHGIHTCMNAIHICTHM